MGAEQSTSRGAGAQAAPAPAKTCYYELLSVERTATDEEIKKAYRRKALELHPDRNLHDTETATRRFAEVQTAYEILSDPQERAWYDSHRDAILRGDDGTDGAGGDSTSSYYNNVRLTPTEEIYTLMGRFNSSVPFNDSPAGFFGILKMFFAQLALEEEAACSWDSQAEPVQYAPFGSAADDYETVAKPFYRDWSNFSTQKSFSWKDKYRLSDAPERAVRRIMEKENRKAREQAIREFNDAVRSLVVFVRKRDPRYVPNTQSEAERQKILRDSATGQAARQRAANQERLAAAANYTEPEWAKVQPADRGAEFEGGFPSDAESEVQEEIECVVCNKTFKSEKQFEAHEKSKKHTKAVQQLRRQMKKENLDFELDIKPEPQLPEEEEDTKSEVEVAHDAVAHDDDGYGDRQTSKGGNVELDDAEGDDEDDDDDDDEDDEYASREAVEKRFRPINTSSDEDDDGVDKKLTEELDGLDIKETPEKKVGKAKAKREKKAARAAAASQQPETTCKVCHESFSSNTRLHKHLRVAHPIPVPISKAKAGGKKKKDQKG